MPTVNNLQNALNDMRNGVYDFTKNGKCTGCGECCSNFLVATPDKVERVRRYIKKRHIKECKHVIPLARNTYDLTCSFLDTNKPDKKCTIYSQRFEICKNFSCHNANKNFNFSKDYIVKARPIDVRRTFFRKEGD